MKHATVEHDNQTVTLVSCQMQLRWCAVLKLGDYIANDAKCLPPKLQTNQRSVDAVTAKMVNQGVTPKCVNTNFGNVTIVQLPIVAMPVSVMQTI